MTPLGSPGVDGGTGPRPTAALGLDTTRRGPDETAALIVKHVSGLAP